MSQMRCDYCPNTFEAGMVARQLFEAIKRRVCGECFAKLLDRVLK